MFLMSNKADGNNNDTAIWSTWEELLLAFAVKRHGDWETVAMELQNRHRSSSSVFTPENCRDKYINLRRRFEGQKVGGGGGGGTDPVFGESFAWHEELRKLRVAELKREVQRYDLSIESLQLKAKTLVEDEIPDLKGNQINEKRSENDKAGGEGQVITPTGKTVSCDDENRSCHESNSTENRPESVPESEGRVKHDPELVTVKDDEDSCDDSSDRRHERIGKESQEEEAVLNEDDGSAELTDSKEEGSQEGIKEMSDVQSSACLMTRTRIDVQQLDGGGSGAAAATAAGIKQERQRAAESEPLYGVLDNIWSQIHGSMFGHRLDSQKTERYKKMIRQHVDLETVQSRIEDGLYSSCPAKFYVDLLLLVNNANVFFPKSSPESLAAHKLRRLVMKELKNSNAPPPSSSDQPSSSPRPQTKPDPGRSDTWLAKHKSTAALIVCKKRSSISGKASSSSGNNKVEQFEGKPSSIPKSSEEDGPLKMNTQEKPVTTGVRSMRRGSSSKVRATVSSLHSGPNAAIQKPISHPLDNNTDKAEASKADKKGAPQAAAAASNSTVKKKGAADFLKRIKKNELGKGQSPESVKYPGESSSKVKIDNNPIKKSDEKKDVRRSGGGGGKKRKNGKEEISPSKRIGRPPKKGKEAVLTGKRGREGEGEGSSKQPKKKSRR